MARSLAFAGALALAGNMTFLTVEGLAQPDTRRTMQASTASTKRDVRAIGMLFDLPAQPLQSALDAYSAITGLSGFYSAESIAGHTSAAIRGWYTPDAVLRMLIENTGLIAYYTAPDAFVLEPAPERRVPRAAASAAGYEGLVQSRVRDEFCRDPRIEPGDYRIAVSFYINEQGRIEQPRLLDSTGNEARDEAILGALRRVDIGLSPADASRPFAMLILPRSLTINQDCE